MSAGDPIFWHRLQFAFTIVYHYLFPQLTMGLGLPLAVAYGGNVVAAAGRDGY